MAETTKLDEFEKELAQTEPTKIDLTTMINKGDFELNYNGGLMEIIKDRKGKGMLTNQQFKLPLKIEMRAKCDGQFCLRFAKGIICFNWHHIRTSLFTRNIAGGEFEYHENRGEVPYDEFVDVEWFIGKEVMAVKVNGEIRHIEIDGGYIKQFEETPDLAISSEINIATGIDSYYGNIDKILTVDLLRVTEL